MCVRLCELAFVCFIIICVTLYNSMIIVLYNYIYLLQYNLLDVFDDDVWCCNNYILPICWCLFGDDVIVVCFSLVFSLFVLCCSRAFKVRRTQKERDTHTHTRYYTSNLFVFKTIVFVCLLTFVCVSAPLFFLLC